MLHSIGVVIARFQVPKLHPGHLHLISEIQRRHAHTLVLLGESRGMPNNHDPLSFSMRAEMVRQAFPNIDIDVIGDEPDDANWSANVDKIIDRYVDWRFGLGHTKGTHACIYGSRSSFIPHYSGVYRTEEIQTIVTYSGTNVRNAITPIHDESFRSGMIYAHTSRLPIIYSTVDMAVVRGDEVLLGCKYRDGGGKFRFPGGFVDVTDSSHADAAKRELFEEVGRIEVGPPIFLGSSKIDDWRYRDTKDCIMTSFYRFDYVYGGPVAKDDLDLVQWMPIKDITEHIIEAHLPLVHILKGSVS